MAKAFNVRVYGLLFDDRDRVLVSDERRHGIAFTKFPGGGLDWGEGIRDCLKREFHEELGVNVEVGQLFYLTDFFQQSAFNPEHQLLSVYYEVKCSAGIVCRRLPEEEEYEVARWIPCAEITEKDMTFPVDKIVAERIREAFGKRALPE